MKRLILTLVLLSLWKMLLAPTYPVVYIPYAEAIRPYEKIWQAVCFIESSDNPLAYNKIENAVGIAQIRQCRIDDYNKRTGKSLRLIEMYEPALSKQVFMFYCGLFGPYNTDLIIRKWNGTGKKTYEYLAKVKERLLSLGIG
jgi:hypothetical protein